MKIGNIKINSTVVLFHLVQLLAALIIAAVAWITDNTEFLRSILSPAQFTVLIALNSAVTLYLRCSGLKGLAPVEIASRVKKAMGDIVTTDDDPVTKEDPIVATAVTTATQVANTVKDGIESKASKSDIEQAVIESAEKAAVTAAENIVIDKLHAAVSNTTDDTKTSDTNTASSGKDSD